MKINIYICVILLFGGLFILNSCKKDPNEYFSEKRSNIVGEWSMIEKRKAYIEGVFQFETEGNEFRIIINEDGTGLKIDNTTSADEREFEWLYQLNPEQIILVYSSTGMFLESTVIYDVITNTSSHQSWERESFPEFGIYDQYEHTLEMTKL